MSYELEATIPDLSLNLLLVKNKGIKLPVVTKNKNISSHLYTTDS